jgi:hypothetical protein
MIETKRKKHVFLNAASNQFTFLDLSKFFVNHVLLIARILNMLYLKTNLD